MAGVTVSSYGLGFVPVSLKYYIGHGWLFAVLLLCGILLSFILAGRAGKGASVSGIGCSDDLLFSRLLLCILCIMALTVCNPFLVKAIVPRFGMTTVYYRAFWVFPLTTGAAYFVTSFCARQKKIWAGLLIFILVFAAAGLTSGLNPAVKNLISGYSMPGNIYKVDGAIPGLCSRIKEDYQRTEEYAQEQKALENADLKTEEGAALLSSSLPACIFPYDMEFSVRQYDAGIGLIFERNMRLYYEGNRSTGLTWNGSKDYKQCAAIVQGMYGLDDTISAKKMKKCLKKTGTEYLIVESDRANSLLLERAGCKRIAQESGYDIWSFGLNYTGSDAAALPSDSAA